MNLQDSKVPSQNKSLTEDSTKFYIVTFSEYVEKYRSIVQRKCVIPESFLIIIHRIREVLCDSQYYDLHAVSYKPITLSTPHDHELVQAFGEIDIKIEKEEDIPYNSIITDIIVDLVFSSEHESYEGLKCRMADTRPRSLSFFSAIDFYMITCIGSKTLTDAIANTIHRRLEEY